jgi:hypothetical protein
VYGSGSSQSPRRDGSSACNHTHFGIRVIDNTVIYHSVWNSRASDGSTSLLRVIYNRVIYNRVASTNYLAAILLLTTPISHCNSIYQVQFILTVFGLCEGDNSLPVISQLNGCQEKEISCTMCTDSGYMNS